MLFIYLFLDMPCDNIDLVRSKGIRDLNMHRSHNAVRAVITEDKVIGTLNTFLREDGLLNGLGKAAVYSLSQNLADGAPKHLKGCFYKKSRNNGAQIGFQG